MLHHDSVQQIYLCKNEAPYLLWPVYIKMYKRKGMLNLIVFLVAKQWQRLYIILNYI